VRDENIKDQDGQAVSRGFGFVEFKHHTHALTALQQTNNVYGSFIWIRILFLTNQ
jgi:hypothetical protein